MSSFKEELRRLGAKGGESLAAEIESLIEASESAEEDTLSLRLLALAAKEIRQGNLSFGHDCIGSAVEAYIAESSGESVEVSAGLSEKLSAVEVAASERSFIFPLPDIVGDEDYLQASEDTVTNFAHLLVNAGYCAEARSYLEAFGEIKKLRGEGEMKRKNAEDLRDYFKKTGNLQMVKAAEEMLEEMPEEAPAEKECRSAAMMKDAEKAGGEMKAAMMKAGYMMRAAEEAEKDGKIDEATAMKAMAEDLYEEAKSYSHAMEDDEMKKAQVQAEGDKPILYVDPPSAEETALMEEATASLGKGDLKSAKVSLAKARQMEKIRLVAALIKVGDTELAMETLAEGEEPSAPAPAPVAEEESGNDYAGEQEEAVEEDSEKPSEMPEGGEPAVQEPSKEPEMPEEAKEAEKLTAKVKTLASKGKMKDAVVAFAKLNHLEKSIVAGVKVARDHKDSELALEGFDVWRSVRKQRLTAEVALAEVEKDQQALDTAMEAMDTMEDESKAAEELDTALEDLDEATGEELTEDFIVPPGGIPEEGVSPELPAAPEEAPEQEEGEENEEEEGEEESQGMHYEVLQSLEEIKAMKVDRNALAFTYWEDDAGENPFYVVQASGKPVAEIHLRDQDDPEGIRAYFCDDTKYTKALAQTVENSNFYEMLRGVRARFYANAVDASAYADKLRKEAVASLSGTRTEKLASLRKDYTDALVVAAEAMNKGLYADKPNPLKAAFAKVLASYGISNPALAVEAAFKDGGQAYFEEVLDNASEYLEMPKEAFAHTKKMVSQASNLAFATASELSDESIAERLSRTSMPFGAVPSTEEAPAVQASIREYSEKARLNDLKSRLKLGRK